VATEEHPVALLLPWYAAGTLEADERTLVERHLPSCPRCRDLLAEASSHAAHYAAAARDDAHVHPALLVRYAESPGDLDAETLSAIEARLARCETCREALALLEETDRAPARAAVEARRGVLDILSSTILRPAAAFAYLVALALLVPLLFDRSAVEAPTSRSISVPRIVRVEADRALRDGGAAGDAVVLRIEAPPAGAPVLLLLVTDLSPDDLRDPALSFDVEVARAGEAAHVETRSGPDFGLEGGRAALPLLLQAVPNEAYAIAIRARKPGDALDGSTLYRRRIVVEGNR
jgi:anti-sigma factor RsiW